ncbi:hypothetical protein AURDEDRAFT_185862 [Auricularia subglabra TFB-10046 SS5]|nr:hypothetical protein AURDEDRAFT_185862 [Auricularia subglabra TFB-10046 SS5]
MAHNAEAPLRDASNAQNVPAGAAARAQKRQREDEAQEDADAPEVDAPEGFEGLFGFADELWSKDALKLAHELHEESLKRDPEVQNIMIFNSYYCYALYDLIEDQFHKFNAKMRKDAKQRETFVLLEAITFFIARDEGTFYGIDDGERFEAFLRLFASAWHTLAARLHTTKPASLLLDIPSASNVMLTAAHIIKTYSKDLRGDFDDVVKLLQIMLCRDGLPYQMKSAAIQGDDGEKPKARKARKRTKVDDEIEDYAKMTFRKAEKEFDVSAEGPYKFATVWSEYCQEHRGQPGLGILFRYIGDDAIVGGWDITKWPAAAREKLSYENYMSEFED